MKKNIRNLVISRLLNITLGFSRSWEIEGFDSKSNSYIVRVSHYPSLLKVNIDTLAVSYEIECQHCGAVKPAFRKVLMQDFVGI